MKKYIKLIALFLLPILKGAFIKAAADELTKMAYPERPRRAASSTFNPPYNRMTSMADVERGFRPSSGRIPKPLEQYHDVLMVAFDITGPNMAVVQEFLRNKMPAARTYVDSDTSIDSWWIADDDDRGSDCDSAVFVSKGNQEAARKLLRLHGLSN